MRQNRWLVGSSCTRDYAGTLESVNHINIFYHYRFITLSGDDITGIVVAGRQDVSISNRNNISLNKLTVSWKIFNNLLD